ncbi:MAG: 3-oxoacyl-ACP reductase [Clostridiaceae bacterium BRH_c20a]|nr:MAG: 3-oxoacyl-ACP reductase [Clostridiaceae bacterium BRH_c20a]
MLLKDKVAIVTGATGGIGRAVIHKLCSEGAKVAGLYRSQDIVAEEIQSELAEHGFETSFYKGSISDEAYIAQTFKSIKDKFGKIDILVNNAGITRDTFLAQMQIDEWKAVFETNFLGTYMCTQEVLPYLLESSNPSEGKYGRVINIISISGVLGREAQANYCASKGAVIGLTRLLSREYSDKGIYFNALAPGLIETEMIGHLPENKRNGMINSTNMKRMGKADEVAGAVLFLCSSLSDYCNNTVLKIDGGMLR